MRPSFRVAVLAATAVLFLAPLPRAAGQYWSDDFGWQVTGVPTNAKGLQTLLKSFPDQERLKVGWEGMSDADMKDVVRLKKLTHLQISGNGRDKVIIGAAGWKELASLTELRVLRVDDAALDEDSLREIGKLAQLTTMRFGNCNMTDAGVKHLSGHKKLSGLCLGGSPITDKSLKEIAKLPSLEMLEVGATKITDDGMRELVGLPYLYYLGLSWTKITDEGLKPLAEIKSLRTLHLDRSKTTEAGMTWLRSKNPNVRNLPNPI